MFPETLRDIQVTGNFCPFHSDNQPVLVKMPEVETFFVLVFSTVEKLEAEMKRIGIDDYKIKHIEDGVEFCESVWEAGVRIMRDPYIVEGSRTHWTEVLSAKEMN
jgi:hypothetical protein